MRDLLNMLHVYIYDMLIFNVYLKKVKFILFSINNGLTYHGGSLNFLKNNEC